MIDFLRYFLSNVQKTPNKTAVVDQGGKRSISYGELADMSARLAAWLYKKGIGRERLVAIGVPRGAAFIVCRFAVMMTGAAWVGVEDMMGAERIAFIIKDSGAELTIDESSFEEAMKEEPLPVEKWADPDPHDMAFIFYTSGSTGTAKGAVQEYGVYRYVLSSIARAIEGFTELNYANIAPETYIGGLQLMAGALCFGNTLHIIPLPLVRDPAGLLSYFRENGIDGSCMPPTLVKALEYAGGLDLRLLHITGEIASDIFIDRFKVMNAYGPTEFSYLPFFFTLDKAYKNTPIGVPDRESEILLLDENGKKNPKEGMMCIRLPYFRGYLHDRVRDDFIRIGGVTYFKSNDYMSVDEKGNYTILGRVDDMVKINGNRIEPSEVEFAVKKILNTGFAAVKAWDSRGSQYLCAYHNCRGEVDPAEMAKKLKELLPLYMIPACYVFIEEIPLNENGKVDKKLLPRPDESSLYAPYAAPENSFQTGLCEAFAEALNIEPGKIGIDDDFFLLGGDSLAAIRVITRMGHDALNVELIYKERTVRGIHRALKDSRKAVYVELSEMIFPLTDQQNFFLDQELELPGRRIYNQPLILRFSPDTDEVRLSEAVYSAFAAHPALLTVIKLKDGVWRQQIVPENNKKLKARQLSEEELQQEKEGFVQPFFFDGSPLFRTGLFKTPNGVFLFMDIHHILCDGYSLRILAEDILGAYEGRELQRDAWTGLLKDITDAGNEKREEDRGFFEAVYGGKFDSGEYSLIPKPDMQQEGHKEGRVDHPFAFGEQEVFKRARELKLSVSAFYILAAELSLMAYNASEKSLILWTFNGRSEARALRTVGLLIRDFPVAISLNREAALQAAVSSLNRQIREALLHGSLTPFSDRSRGEVTDFLYQGDLVKKAVSGPLRAIEFPLIPEKTAIEAFELYVYEDEEGSRLRILYDAGMYKPESMERFARLYEGVCSLLLEQQGRGLTVKDILRRVSETGV